MSVFPCYIVHVIAAVFVLRRGLHLCSVNFSLCIIECYYFSSQGLPFTTTLPLTTLIYRLKRTVLLLCPLIPFFMSQVLHVYYVAAV